MESFSSIIIEKNCIKQQCNMGHWHVIYRLNFRKCLIPALRYMQVMDVPMTSAKIANHFTGTLSRSIGKYLSELLHWNLIIKCNDKYLISREGRLFLNGVIKIQKYVWPEGTPGVQNGELISMRDIPEYDFEDKGLHVENAAPSMVC